MNVVWITGLPGSGKTTLAKRVLAYFQSSGVSAILLDGDEIREALGSIFGYSMNDRMNVAKIYVNLAKTLQAQGHLIIVSTVSLMEDLHRYRMERLPNSIVVFLNADAELLNLRNQKNLRTQKIAYSPGVSMPAEFPQDAKFVFTGNETESQVNKFLLELEELLK
jgi:adenylylsulfate kinase-like enzyme